MMSSTARSYTWTTVLLACTVLLTPHAAQAQATQTVHRTVNLDRDGRVRLSTFTGSISIATWDRAAVQIDVRIEGEEQEHVDATRIRVEESSREVQIETDYDALENSFLGLFDTGDEDRPATFYTIRMPVSAALSIEDFSSEIEVTGLRADLSLETFSSPVTLRDIDGYLRAETYSSELEAQDLAGGIRLETFSGDATIAMHALTDDCQFESFSGDVELLLPPDASFDLDAELGMSGDVHSDFAFTSAGTEDDEYRGTVNGGGPRIRFDTFSGDLVLRRE